MNRSRKRKKTASKKGLRLSPVNLRIAVAQVNPIVGDFKFNVNLVRSCLKEARRNRADIIVFPELVLTGYPPEDLLLKQSFINSTVDALHRIVPDTKSLAAVIGYAEPGKTGLHNSVALAAGGKLLGSYRKMMLPNYGVFDEKRYFKEGSRPVRFSCKGVMLGLSICEDIWVADGPGKPLCHEGEVDVLINASSSPYFKGKGKSREEMIRQRARSYKAHVVYANLVGGQDELVFDGHSLVVSPAGKLLLRGNSFNEEICYVDLEVNPKQGSGKRRRKPADMTTCRVPSTALTQGPKRPLPQRTVRELGEAEEIYEALVLGTRDYIRKNGFGRVVIGLSGGIDSSLTAAIAADALGAENVVGVMMPSPYSSQGSIHDAEDLALNLNIETMTLPIDEAMKAYDHILEHAFEGVPTNVAEENLQARVRGNLVMALSNKFGWLVLTTGNKSEVSVGYCTLYGDMAGGLAVIKDVPKTWVYELCRWDNRREQREIIPESVFTKEPSAELRPDQKDTDALPEYPKLDKVLHQYIEEDKAPEEIKGGGLTRAEIRQVIRWVDANEYKRRQGPPGIKITPKAFGRDRRMPITNHFKG